MKLLRYISDCIETCATESLLVSAYPNALRRVAFSGCSDKIMTSRAMTPFPNGKTTSIALLGPAIAMRTCPACAAGVAPNTGAMIICEYLWAANNDFH
jgi:hypothetical protein